MVNLKIWLFLIAISLIVLPCKGYAQTDESQLKMIFTEVDTNQDSFLSKEEYLAYYFLKIAPMIEVNMADASSDEKHEIHNLNSQRFMDGPFGAGDQNNDDLLSFDEYVAFHNSLIE